MKKTKRTPEQVFEQNIQKTPSECWLWTGATDQDGRPVIRWRNRQQHATRFSYWLHTGRVPTRRCLGNTCEVNRCVNPDHLIWDQFLARWGISRGELAQQEGVTTAAINMRVMKWGSPWQRHAQPTNIERETGRCVWELSVRLRISPAALHQRWGATFNVFYTPVGKGRRSVNWAPDPDAPSRPRRESFWLHPRHPDYQAQRAVWITYCENLVNTGVQVPDWAWGYQ